MGVTDFLFGSTDKLEPQDVRSPFQRQTFDELLEAARGPSISRLEQAGREFPVTPLTGMEQQGISSLRDFLDSPLPSEGDLFQSAKDEISQTLAGGRDPFESEYYNAYQQNVKRELQEAVDRIKAQRSSREGGIFGGGLTNVLGELEETTTGNLMEFLGQLQERERERQLQAVPQALQISALEEMYPLSRIETALSPQFGGFERGFGELERAEEMRAFGDLGLGIDLAADLSTFEPSLYYPSYSSTPGLFGGPSGIGQQPGGEAGDAQRVQSIMSVIAGLSGPESSLSELIKKLGAGQTSQGARI